MNELERASKLIGDIYDAALDPALWPSVFESTCNFLQGCNAAMCVHESGAGRSGLLLQWGFDPDIFQKYNSTYARLNPLNIPALLYAKPGSVLTPADMHYYEEVVASRFFREWAAPQGHVDAMLLTIEKSAMRYSAIAINRHEHQGRVDDAMRRRAELLTPHFCRAVAIGKVIELNRIEAVVLADTLDGLSSALFLVDADGKVMHANASGQAMLQTQEVVRAPGARLTATELQADRALQDVIAAAALGDAIGTARGASLPLRGPKGENHVAHVLPLGFGRRREAGANYFAVAAVFVRKAEFELTHPVEALARRYKLTAAEMRVLMAIVEVGGVPEVAEALEISQATVRTHLSRLFDKTGTNRQADLVKIVAGFASPLIE